jgi:hypothetical protein
VLFWHPTPSARKRALSPLAGNRQEFLFKSSRPETLVPSPSKLGVPWFSRVEHSQKVFKRYLLLLIKKWIPPG